MSFEALKADLARYGMRETIELKGFRGHNTFETVDLTVEELARLIIIVEESMNLYEAAKARFEEWNPETFKNIGDALKRYKELCEQ